MKIPKSLFFLEVVKNAFISINNFPKQFLSFRSVRTMPRNAAMVVWNTFSELKELLLEIMANQFWKVDGVAVKLESWARRSTALCW